MIELTSRELQRGFESYADKNIRIKGWVRTHRDQKTIGFIMMHDGTHFHPIQVVYDQENLINFEEVKKFRVGAAVEVVGKIRSTPKAKQPFEIHAERIVLLADSTEDYPIQPKRHTREYLREVAHLRPRTNLFTAVFRVRSLLSYAVHTFFQERGFVYVHTPIITASDAEGAGQMFKVTTLDDRKPMQENCSTDYTKDFFGKKTNLTVSGQLEAEAFALAFKDVYTFGPTFRAENSNTARHAAEFWMIEPEMAFADLVKDMNLAEEMVKYLIEYTLAHAGDEMEFFNEFVEKGLVTKLCRIRDAEFERLSYGEAIKILEKSERKFDYPVIWGKDLQTEHERYLTEVVFGKPVFVTDYPKDIKAFYMRLNKDEKTVAAMDLLVPGVGEIIGGSQREERVHILEQRMKEYSIDPQDLQWYMDLRNYGGVEHAGFGLGFERMLMYLMGISNIRDVIPFPRTVKSCDF